MKPVKKLKTRRILVYSLLGFVLLCVTSTGISAWSNRSLPTASPVIERLSEAEKARLAELFHLKGELGQEVWPGWGQMDIPIILYNEEYAFLVGYPDPPEGWVKIPDGETRGSVWEAVPGDTFQGQPYYRQRLPDSGETPQSFTVRVGERWAASMMTKDWMRISMVNDMRDQLPPPLAPVFPYRLVVGLIDSDWYIVLALHESFHAYQGAVAPERLNSAEMAVRNFGSSYPWDDSQIEADWKVELGLLADAIQAGTDTEAAALVRQFLTQREARQQSNNLSPDHVDYERQREWLEGLAKYVELTLWRQAFETAGYTPLPAVSELPDFKAYTTFERHWADEMRRLRRPPANTTDNLFYSTGMAQAVLLDRLMPGWKELVLLEGIWLEDLLTEAVQ